MAFPAICSIYRRESLPLPLFSVCVHGPQRMREPKDSVEKHKAIAVNASQLSVHSLLLPKLCSCQHTQVCACIHTYTHTRTRMRIHTHMHHVVLHIQNTTSHTHVQTQWYTHHTQVYTCLCTHTRHDLINALKAPPPHTLLHTMEQTRTNSSQLIPSSF